MAASDGEQLPAEPRDEVARRGVLRDAGAIGLTTGAYAISFGALGVTTGLSVVQTCALSLLMFTGASQFALLGVLAGGGGAISAAATAAMVGSRNALYALRMAPLLRVRGGRRLLAAHLVIDESTAMAVARPPGPLGRLAFYATGLAVLACWNAGTLTGALAGQALGDPRTYGLDVAASAAFVALMAPQVCSREAKLVALAAGVVALGGVPLLPAGVPVMVGALVAVGLVALARTGGRLMWTAVLLGCAACYALKLAGFAVPARLLSAPRLLAVSSALPVALLAGLIAVQTFGAGQRLVVDVRLAGLAAALAAVRLRASFLVVVVAGAGTTALLRAVG